MVKKFTPTNLVRDSFKKISSSSKQINLLSNQFDAELKAEFDFLNSNFSKHNVLLNPSSESLNRIIRYSMTQETLLR
jgi:hypothetical protein